MGVVSLNEDTLEANLTTTLDVLAWEVELAAARCIQLDSVVGQMMEMLPLDQQAAFVDNMQMVDLLSQQLTNLSAFARRMSECIPGEFSATVQTALGEITLGALADRMRTALGGEEKGISDGDEAGDLDLF